MAKRRKTLLKLQVDSSVQPKVVPLQSADGLPPYQRYFDTKEGARFFFEPALNHEEYSKKLNPSIVRFLYSGSLSNSPGSFFSKAKEVLGEFATCLARQLIHYTQTKSGSCANLSLFNKALNEFVSFMEIKEIKPSSFKQITVDTLISFGNYLILENRPISALDAIKRLFFQNPEINNNEYNKIRACKFKKQSLNNDNHAAELEKVLNQGYSDKELIQLLAYVYYDLENMIATVTHIDRIKNQGLGDNHVPYDIINSSADKIKSLLKSGPEGFEILIDNILLAGINASSKTRYFDKLRLKIKTLKIEEEYKQFSCYVRKDTWAYRANILHEKELPIHVLQGIRFLEHINGSTSQYGFCLIIYVLLTTGINLCVLMSWKRIINGKLWYENFDKFLGSDEDAPSRDRSVLMFGVKKKTGVMASKKIPTAIPIHSPLFKYLKAYDKAHDPNRENFIVGTGNILNATLLKYFLTVNPIYSEKNEPLTTIHTRLFRKVFAGHKLLSLLGDVKTADELVFKLKESLNHASFDTTLFSYIMKAGIGNQILDSAIVALTSDLLEKSLKFNGQIKAEGEKTKGSISVFLCDCADPSQPTHNVPINHNHCRKYDLCLGCERSEVYAEHVPNICYRVLQYEEMRENNLDIYRASMEDRHAIALDTLKKFEFKHAGGIDLLANAYAYANECFANNKPLLPAILQTERL